MDLKNKIVIITGSSSGIGEATAELFASRGAKIVVNSETNMEGGERVAERIRRAGGEAVYVKADVSDPVQSRALIETSLKKFGTVDVLINNAGRWRAQDFITSTKEEWLQLLDTNLFGAILCSQAVAPIMLKNGSGKILNTASVYGLEHTGDPSSMVYSVAKAGVISLTKNLAKLWAPTILVNAVAPGYVHLPRFDTFDDATRDTMIGEMRLGRWIEPQEIAHAFLYLAESDAVTGEVLTVDAGFRLK